MRINWWAPHFCPMTPCLEIRTSVLQILIPCVLSACRMVHIWLQHVDFRGTQNVMLKAMFYIRQDYGAHWLMRSPHAKQPGPPVRSGPWPSPKMRIGPCTILGHEKLKSKPFTSGVACEVHLQWYQRHSATPPDIIAPLMSHIQADFSRAFRCWLFASLCAAPC